MRWDVTGMGVVSPLGSTPTEFFEALSAGQDAHSPLRHFDAQRFRMSHAYQIPAVGIPEPALRATTWLCTAVSAALADAGVDPGDVPVFVGTPLGEQRSAELWLHRGGRLPARD